MREALPLNDLAAALVTATRAIGCDSPLLSVSETPPGFGKENAPTHIARSKAPQAVVMTGGLGSMGDFNGVVPDHPRMA